MLNLVSYTDEGGHSEDPTLNYIGMAGFVAPAGTWDVFSGQWLEVLKNAGLKEPFHMREFAHRKDQFENWTENDRKALLRALMPIIRDTKAEPIGAVVSLDDYDSLTDIQKQYLREPYYFVFQFVTRIAATQATIEPLGEQVAMVYSFNDEYGVTFAGRANKLWHRIRNAYMEKEPDIGCRMGSYASRTPDELAPLQAADLFAYELVRDFQSIKTRLTLGMRWPLKQVLRMCKIPKPSIMLFDRKELLRILRDTGCPDQTGVEEIDDIQKQSAIDIMQRWLNERGQYESEWPKD